MKKPAIAVLGIAALGLAIAASQLSVLRLGAGGSGATVLLWRTGDLSDLQLFDSAQAACKRKSATLFGSTLLCEGALALRIRGDERVLLRWSGGGR